MAKLNEGFYVESKFSGRIFQKDNYGEILIARSLNDYSGFTRDEMDKKWEVYGDTPIYDLTFEEMLNKIEPGQIAESCLVELKNPNSEVDMYRYVREGDILTNCGSPVLHLYIQYMQSKWRILD